MDPETAHQDGYEFPPKNEKILSLRTLFSEKKEAPKTDAEKSYGDKLSKSGIGDKLEKAEAGDIRDLLKIHWSMYDYETWTRAMDAAAELLKLKGSETLFELGFGSGAILRYLHQKYPDLSLAGNDFFELYVEEAKRSEYIGNGAFVHANSRYLDFIPDNTFDAALSWGSFGYEDKEGVVKSLKDLIRICKPGGRILIGNIDDSENPPSAAYKSAYQTSLSKKELEELLRGEPVKIITLGTDKEVIGIEGHLADSRLTICIEKNGPPSPDLPPEEPEEVGAISETTRDLIKNDIGGKPAPGDVEN